MRIVTWNCEGGFHKRVEALLSQNPDVAVVQECLEKSTAALQQRGYETLWFGSNPLKKGLAVLCRKGWSIRALPLPQQKWIVPVEIDGPTPFTLLAVWAMETETREEGYIRQVYHALMSHPEWFDVAPVVLAGDLNSNKIWDSKREVGNHSDVVKILTERGLVSAYHEFFVEAQGAETRPTLHMHHADKPYHIDYIFIPREWTPRLKTVEVGAYEEWSKRSDHCPVTVWVLTPQQ